MCDSSYWQYVFLDLSGPGTMIADNGLLYVTGTKPKQSVLSGVNSPPNAGTWTVVSPNGVIDRTRGVGS